ncbi:Endonuclease/exonuclease/phosphatase, partial [Coprinopsis sp. MPI-PUGE-AT-0042]
EAYHPSRAVFIFEGGIPEAERLPPDEICQRLNEGLAKIPKARHFKIVAAKYTQHGNLLVNTKATQNASELVEHAAQLLPLLHSKHKASARPDVKWWKIQIDGVATRRLTVAGDVEPYTGEAVHNELKTCNQLYADIAKHIVATPRWLRTAEELRRTLHSSLVFAIDNEDAAKALLKDIRPRTMTYVKVRNDFAVTLRTDLLEHPDAQILEISRSGHPCVTIVNVYNDPRLKDACVLKALRQVDLPNQHPVLITGDFNLHHILWSKGRVAHDRLAEETVDWLSDAGYLLLNTKGEITHPARHPHERDSVIDLSFANIPAIANDTFKDWCVDPSLSHDSDHYAIRFVIDEGRQEILNPTGIRYSLKDAKPQEWIKTFNHEIERVRNELEILTLQENLTYSDLDHCEEILTTAIQNTTAKIGK